MLFGKQLLERSRRGLSRQLVELARRVHPGLVSGGGSVAYRQPLSARLIQFLQRVPDRDCPASLIFDLEGVRGRMVALGDLGRPATCKILMPVKALPLAPFLRLGRSELDGFDVSNDVEYNDLPADLRGRHVSLNSPTYLPASRYDLVRKGNTLIIYISCEEQFRRLESLDLPVDYGIRIQSSCLLTWPQRLRAGRPQASRFGVDPRDLRLLKRMVSSAKHHFVGLHVHHGFGQNDASTYQQLAAGAVALGQELDVELESINLGGGLHAVPPSAVGSLISAIRGVLPARTLLFLEPGEYLTISCAAAAGSIRARLPRAGWPTFVINLSANCHLRWSYPFPVGVDGKPPRGSNCSPVRLVGPTCAESDDIGRFPACHPHTGGALQVGDTLFLGGINGYSAAWNSSFNGVPPAQVLFLPDDGPGR